MVIVAGHRCIHGIKECKINKAGRHKAEHDSLAKPKTMSDGRKNILVISITAGSAFPAILNLRGKIPMPTMGPATMASVTATIQ